MIINEIFESIQGEGKFAGHPALFIRTSGCTRNCDFCDTKYHKDGKKISEKSLIKRIKNSGLDYIVWTGGEPMMQEEKIYEVIMATSEYYHHLETNGDILPQTPNMFSYIGFSPKEKRIQQNVLAYVSQLENIDWDIKVVTDLKLNKDMIEDATMLMPLTTFGHIYSRRDNSKIQRNVWNYCVKNNIKYAHRIHVDVWGTKKGV